MPIVVAAAEGVVDFGHKGSDVLTCPRRIVHDAAGGHIEHSKGAVP